jgi:hypothetical protein
MASHDNGGAAGRRAEKPIFPTKSLEIETQKYIISGFMRFKSRNAIYFCFEKKTRRHVGA